MMKKQFIFVFLALTVLLLSGCANDRGTSSVVSDGSAYITGEFEPSENSLVIIRNVSGEIYVPLQKDGKFSVPVKPGIYSILLQEENGKLQLIKKDVLVEDLFTISKLDVKLVPVPRIVSVSVAQVLENSAVIEWETDIDSDGRVDYGTDASYGQTSFTETTLKKFHRIQIYNLQPGNRYHFRVVASRHSLDSTINYSADYEFTT